MSQAVKNLLASGLNMERIQTEDLAFVSPVKNRVFVLGGSNITTSGSGNTVTTSLNNSITIDSATIDDINIQNDTISTTNGNKDIRINPNGSGKIQLSNENSLSALLTNSSGELVTTPMSNGQVVIGSTGTTPQVANLTAGNGITITNGSNSITISASGTGGPGGGGFLQWDNYTYTGSEQLRYTLTPNHGVITNSSVASSTQSGYCPHKNFVLTVPPSNQLTVGDSFWVVNKGVGSFIIRGHSDQQWASKSVQIFQYGNTNLSTFSSFFIKPSESGQQYQYRKYVYLSNVLLTYVGEMRLYNSDGTLFGTFPHVFVFTRTVGNLEGTNGNASSFTGCYITS